jgi:hypothetical protein
VVSLPLSVQGGNLFHSVMIKISGRCSNLVACCCLVLSLSTLYVLLDIVPGAYRGEFSPSKELLLIGRPGVTF